MSDKELEEYINKIEPNFDSHLEKGTIEMSNEYYNLLEEKMARVINNNQELKTELKESNDSVIWWSNRFNAINKQNEELKKQLENTNEQIEYLRRSIERKEDTIIDLQNERIPYTNEYVCKLEAQQKEFIEYMNKTIEELECDDVDDEEMKGYLIQRIDTFKEIFSKYKELIGCKE